MIPSRARGKRVPTCRAMAAPWLNPASTMREEGTPRSSSRSSTASICRAERRTSSARSPGPGPPNEATSYQAGMTIPPLMVTGRAGAFGNTKRTMGRPRKDTTGSKSWPSAPRPWSQTTAPRGSPRAWTSTQGSRSVPVAPPLGQGAGDPLVEGLDRLGQPGHDALRLDLRPVVEASYVGRGSLQVRAPPEELGRGGRALGRLQLGRDLAAVLGLEGGQDG